MMVVQHTSSAYQLAMSDIVVSPKIGHIGYHKMGRADEVIAAGYEAGLESIAKIQQLIDSAAPRQEMLA
jgi:predicted acylesterase/phospholipase RssA